MARIGQWKEEIKEHNSVIEELERRLTTWIIYN